MRFNILTFLTTFLILISLILGAFFGFVEIGPNITNNTKNVLAADTAPSVNKELIVINPGHAVASDGSNYPGFLGDPGEPLKNLNLAKKLKAELEKRGYQAELTHNGPPEVSIPAGADIQYDYRYKEYQRRVDKSNSLNPALYVEIHFNDSNTNPFSIYSSRPDQQWVNASREAGKAIVNGLQNKLGISATPREESDSGDIGGRTGGHLYTIGPEGEEGNPGIANSKILRENKAVAAYIETLGNHDPRSNNLDLLAEGYADGIINYLNNATYFPNTGGKETLKDTIGAATDVCTGLKSVNPSAFFCQSDPKWGGTNAPRSGSSEGCSLAHAGCGPSTAAMILARTGYAKFPIQNDWGGLNLSNLDGLDAKGQEVNPLTVDHLFAAGGWRPAEPNYCGSDFYGFTNWLTKINYTSKPVGINMKEIADAIQDGYTLAVSDNQYGGHLYGISGADLSSNTLTVFDPAQCATGGDVKVDYATFSGQGVKAIWGVKNNGP